MNHLSIPVYLLPLCHCCKILVVNDKGIKPYLGSQFQRVSVHHSSEIWQSLWQWQYAGEAIHITVILEAEGSGTKAQSVTFDGLSLVTTAIRTNFFTISQPPRQHHHLGNKH